MKLLQILGITRTLQDNFTESIACPFYRSDKCEITGKKVDRNEKYLWCDDDYKTCSFYRSQVRNEL